MPHRVAVTVIATAAAVGPTSSSFDNGGVKTALDDEVSVGASGAVTSAAV